MIITKMNMKDVGRQENTMTNTALIVHITVIATERKKFKSLKIVKNKL